jgi:hypothetical protein
MIHLIAMQVRAAAPARRRNAFGEHGEDVVEILAVQAAIRVRPAHQREQVILTEFFTSRCRDNLLRQNIERSFRNLRADRARPAGSPRPRAAHSINSSRVVGKESALGQRSYPVSGSSHALATRLKSTAANRSDTPDPRCRCRYPSSSEAVATTDA